MFRILHFNLQLSDNNTSINFSMMERTHLQLRSSYLHSPPEVRLCFRLIAADYLIKTRAFPPRTDFTRLLFVILRVCSLVFPAVIKNYPYSSTLLLSALSRYILPAK